MRHAAITPARSKARLGLRRPEAVGSGRHSARDAVAPGLLDAPTVSIPRVHTSCSVEDDVFAGREHVFAVGGAGRTPRELWNSATPRARATTAVGAALALLSIGMTGGHDNSAASASSSTSTSASSSRNTTPLGCDVHEVYEGPWNTATDDPFCTQRKLAAKLCDLDVYGQPRVAGTLQLWSGSEGQVILSGTTSTMTFRCTDYSTEAHTATFTLDEWDDLISPGSMTSTLSRELANA
ncbi:hypothetical protein [Actinomycetospora atypica]|uniref:Serine/threonine protein kinase n=1 Tax=Actinomycetospora atypica TaxID=1290095 RepID=A0ABV9YFU6_9PSEU